MSGTDVAYDASFIRPSYEMSGTDVERGGTSTRVPGRSAYSLCQESCSVPAMSQRTALRASWYPDMGRGQSC
eukprot:2162428-Rhodomonas_salina.2